MGTDRAVFYLTMQVGNELKRTVKPTQDTLKAC